MKYFLQNLMAKIPWSIIVFLISFPLLISFEANAQKGREKIKFNENWKFFRYASGGDSLIYDIRPSVEEYRDDKDADTMPTEADLIAEERNTLKKWVLPTANDFIKDPSKHHVRPDGHPGKDFPFVQSDFDDKAWESVDLPHDWAISGPFYTEENPIIGGGMGRLPVQGVAWYRKSISLNSGEEDKTIYLDIDGAMSYAMVWLNGHLIGGWPYGYNSFRLDLTPFLKTGENQIAIRIDNPSHSARWYPGAGLYRNVWLTKVNPVHVSHWGTFITTEVQSNGNAHVDLAIQVENRSDAEKEIRVETEIHELDAQSKRSGNAVTSIKNESVKIPANGKAQIDQPAELSSPKLWGPSPTQNPHLYVAHTKLYSKNEVIDEYETIFGIRTVVFDPNEGLIVNGEQIRIQGVNQHHDLGALGAAFNKTAAERQLLILKEMGCNAIRMAHNPPASELLDLTDQLGFLVIDEIFDSWERKKTPLDFHLIFPDWYEADTRSFVRRDRNHPSIIAWSFGNEVGEQYTGEAGAAIAQELHEIVKEEDPTRPTTLSMNYAKPDMPFAAVADVINLNYQGEGIRDGAAYSHLQGIRTSPLYPAFREKFPEKTIISSETASALSTRGTYIFPVIAGNSAPVSEGIGGNESGMKVSAYELYTSAFGASPDKVFASQDQHPYVAGEFVWSGFDYIGEPTPYYSARSSYSGIIDLAGFEKDRFYLYQSRWRPDLKMAHILPHWTWPGREGEVTPVHVFTSGDEAELFLNGQSLGRKKKAPFTYRLRWDDVTYSPGELQVIAYKNGQKWAMSTVKTVGKAVQLSLEKEPFELQNNELIFIRAAVLDLEGLLVPDSADRIKFELEGPGKIVATDNGNPADMEVFPSTSRDAFSGKALVIIKPDQPGQTAGLVIKAKSQGLTSAALDLTP